MRAGERVWQLLLVGPLLACGSVSTRATGDAGVAGLRACSTSGPGAVLAAGSCWMFSPASAGASAAGQNATGLSDCRLRSPWIEH